MEELMMLREEERVCRMNAVECRMESMECDEEADRALLQFKFSEANKWREEPRQ